MPSKKYLELQEFSDADLTAEVTEREAALNQLIMDHSIRGLDNPMEIRAKRRDLARLKTELRRRELAGMDESQIAKRSKIRERRRIN